jgi:Predicted dehydrogenases and related proteins
MIRWGIIGLGTIAEKFAKTVSAMDSKKNILAAAASRDMNKAADFAKRYGIDTYFDSYEKLFESGSVDAVYISTPNNLHFENCMAALTAGKHVLCEKPFATDANKAEELYKFAEEKGLFIMEALWTFHLPLLKKTAEMLKGGIIGDVEYIRADYGFIAEGARRERKFRSGLGGGALLDVGIYNIGFAKMMYGRDPVDINTSCILNEYGTDSFGNMLAKYSDTEFASLTSSIGLKMNTEGVIYGTKGRIYFPDHQKAEYMRVLLNDGTETEYKSPFELTGFEYQIDECLRCIEQGMSESPYYTHEQSIQVMQTLDMTREKWNMRFSFE